jgi:pimeloyl-ACP methyl ester carboxylesterase
VVVELPAVDVQARQRQRALAPLRELLTALFLHGLAGTGSEWDRLQAAVRAEAPDLSPYGTRDEYVGDVVELIEEPPVMLIGQSLGGHTAMLVAARHPALVARLVLIELSPERDEGVVERVRAYFEGNPSAYGAPVDPDAVAQTVAELEERDWWDEFGLIQCPVLIVRGEHGDLDPEVVASMLAANRQASAVTIAGAGHDVHLDEPGALAEAIQAWLSSTSAT